MKPRHASPPEEERKSSRDFLQELSKEIMGDWEARVRGEVSPAGDMLRPALRNTLGRFLDLLGDSLSEGKARGMQNTAKSLVQDHARGRAKSTTYSGAQVAQELQMLREIVTKKLESSLPLSGREYATIQKTFDQAIQEALLEYFLVHASLREQFVATLTHDLRGPLSAARMGAQLSLNVARGLKDREKGDQLAKLQERIVDTLARADRMIQELLDASRLRVGEKIPLQLSRCDLLKVAQDATRDLSEEAKSKVRVTGESTEGCWDKDGLKRSIGNLISNAVKYGSPQGQIFVLVARSADRATVAVHNEGNPISEVEQKELFRSFHRGQEAIASGHKGWGIGLALAKALVESMNGSLRVESSPARGTTFTIELPLGESKVSGTSEAV